MNQQVLIFVNHYLPGFKSGGPIRSVSNIVQSCKAEFSFNIVTRDRDSGDDEPYSNILVNDWSDVAGARVFYGDKKYLSFLKVYRLMKACDFEVLYLNSFFDPNFTLRPLLINAFTFRRPVVLCPRGEFSPGALGLKPFKKRLFIFLFNLLGLKKNVIWHATTLEELELIKKKMGPNIKSIIAPNISITNLNSSSFQKKSSRLQMVFLSRISEKKNLLGALESLRRVNQEVSFDIYGNASRAEDKDYQLRCEKIAQKMPPNVKVRFCGEVKNEDVVKTLWEYDLFFLPTFGENFGHAIIEALSAGLPLLISDKTPWNDLEEKGVGWVGNPEDYDFFAKKIDSVAEVDSSKHLEMRKKALSYAKEFYSSSKAIEKTRELFRVATNGT